MVHFLKYHILFPIRQKKFDQQGNRTNDHWTCSHRCYQIGHQTTERGAVLTLLLSNTKFKKISGKWGAVFDDGFGISMKNCI